MFDRRFVRPPSRPSVRPSVRLAAIPSVRPSHLPSVRLPYLDDNRYAWLQHESRRIPAFFTHHLLFLCKLVNIIRSFLFRSDPNPHLFEIAANDGVQNGAFDAHVRPHLVEAEGRQKTKGQKSNPRISVHFEGDLQRGMRSGRSS